MRYTIWTYAMFDVECEANAKIDREGEREKKNL